jgi:nitrite reductase (NO-forming)
MEDGHSMRPVSGGDRPQPSGKLAQIYDASLAPLDPAPTKTLVIEAADAKVEVAAGVTLNAWTFDGAVPGKVVHVREGDTIDFTLRNRGTMGHSIDFHAARIAPNRAFRDVAPGESFTFRFKANDPGVYMYHCGTKPVLMHIANGMYGAIVVEPSAGWEPAREYVLVQSEFYLKQAAASDGTWDGDSARMLAVQPDFVVFNGASLQYQQAPLKASPGERVRLHVVNAGPTLFSAFHVIGALFDRAYADGNPANVQRGMQTVTVPPGGGYTCELVIPEPGKYPFVTHSFAYTGLGAVGVIEVA